MSKTPLITKNDGTDWHDAVPKLRTDELGASSTDWVQEDDTKAVSLKVTANGTYAAASAGKYGYDYVTVSVKGGSATGTGPDGNEHTVYPDPETGKLIDEVIPSSIVVTTPPTVTTYQDGDTIDFTGIVVTAYKADGTVWSDADHPNGVIPVSELSFNPTRAEYDAESAVINLDGDGIHMLGYIGAAQYRNNVWRVVYKGLWGLPYVPSVGDEYPDIVYPLVAATTSDAEIKLYLTVYNGDIYVATSKNINVVGIFPDEHTAGAISASTHIRKRTFSGQGAELVYDVLESMAEISTVDPEGVLYSSLTETDLHSVQTITVSWPRPGDGAVLEASFPIYVTSANT